MSNFVKDSVEAYFSSLNSTSSRMMADITFAKQQHGEKWSSLSEVDQAEALWQSLVKPEIEGKYDPYPADPPDMESFPTYRIKPGEKIVVDEDAAAGKPFGCTWRDEHSSPFRWETRSQLDIRFSDKDKMTKTESVVTAPTNAVAEPASENVSEEKKEEEVKRPPPLKRPEVPPPPVPPHFIPPIPPHAEDSPPVPPHLVKHETPIYAKVVKRKSCGKTKTLVISELKAHKRAMEEMKPAVPPRMSLELKGDIDHTKYKGDSSDDLESIPKTGFDFLDNW